MNELARLVSFSFGYTQNYRIVDRNGNPWFALKDFCKILGIKNPSDAVKDFPPEYVSSVVCDIDLSYITSAKPRARKTQKILIISEAGLLRLITRSDKPIARQIQAKIFEEILPARFWTIFCFPFRGLNRRPNIFLLETAENAPVRPVFPVILPWNSPVSAETGLRDRNTRSTHVKTAYGPLNLHQNL
jgi:hypothetical protein